MALHLIFQKYFQIRHASIRLLQYKNRETLQMFSKGVTATNVSFNKINENVTDWKQCLYETMKIYPEFITPEEENSLIEELDPYLQRMQYEFAHWDDAIHGYKETERNRWNDKNSLIIEKIRKKAFSPGIPQLNFVHVLDLAAEGWIKPHVDSVRFCGDIIAGLSLLSDSIMRLTMVGKENECKADFHLPRRSLYIMSGVARYKYNHEILKSEESVFKGSKIQKSRRVSVICRSKPEHEDD